MVSSKSRQYSINTSEPIAFRTILHILYIILIQKIHNIILHTNIQITFKFQLANRHLSSKKVQQIMNLW